MKKHTITSAYRQFYVADVGLNPPAPEEWNDEHVRQRYNADKNIVALCPEGDLTARIICIPPGKSYENEKEPEFEVNTQVTIETGKLGVMEWPWEKIEKYNVDPGVYFIRFSGFNLAGVDDQEDYYIVEFKRA
ncbi:MAG: hypothetical protein AB1393_14645 [Candidatus Edwardsbacteria bacterium]